MISKHARVTLNTKPHSLLQSSLPGSAPYDVLDSTAPGLQYVIIFPEFSRLQRD